MNKYYCCCISLPPAGSFTIGETYPCTIPKAGPGIMVYDNDREGLLFKGGVSDSYFEFYAEHQEVPSSELPAEKLYMVLAWGKPTISEIRAYAQIRKVDYISAKKTLSDQQTFIAKGDHSYIEELCGVLDQYGVKYVVGFDDR